MAGGMTIAFVPPTSVQERGETSADSNAVKLVPLVRTSLSQIGETMPDMAAFEEPPPVVVRSWNVTPLPGETAS